MRGRFRRQSKINLLKSFSILSAILAALTYSHVALAIGPDMQLSAPPPAVIIEPEDVLWDQTADVSDTDITSQDFIDGGGVFDIYDTRAADDFLVPDGFRWSIRTVRVLGMFDTTPDPPQSLDVLFYWDDDGLPGEVIESCRFEKILPEDLLDPNFTINLPERRCNLRPGQYWMSVRANMLFLPNGQWFWNENTVQRLNPFVWENPGNGFGTGCTVFSPAQADCGAIFPDLSFQLIGEEQPFPAVPTLSRWGMFAVAAALGLVAAASVFAARRRKNGARRVSGT